MKLPENLKAVEDEIKNWCRERGYQIDAMARMKWIDEIQRVDKVTREEALEMIQNDPQYSLGWKMCGIPILRIAASGREAQKFRELLTPEEDRIFTEEVLMLNIKKMIRKESRKKRVKTS